MCIAYVSCVLFGCLVWSGLLPLARARASPCVRAHPWILLHSRVTHHGGANVQAVPSDGVGIMALDSDTSDAISDACKTCKWYRCLWKESFLQVRRLAGRLAFKTPNQVLESSLCGSGAGQGLAEKELFFPQAPVCLQRKWLRFDSELGRCRKTSSWLKRLGIVIRSVFIISNRKNSNWASQILKATMLLICPYCLEFQIARV